MNSNYYSRLSLWGIQKSGNILVPGLEGSPSFSEIGCIEHIDRMLENMPSQDVKDIGIVFALFALTPTPILRALFWILSKSHFFPDRLGGHLFRLLWMGIRGIIFSLAYSGYTGRNAVVSSKLAGLFEYDVFVAPRSPSE